VSYPAPFDPETDREHEIVECARSAARVAAGHAARHDRDGSFPEEGLAALASSGYLALVVPESLGGRGACVSEMVLGNLELAKGDASLGLVVAMHGAFVGRVRDAGAWPPQLFEQVGCAIASARDGHGALINSLASEPELGSPSRGGLPRTRAERTAAGWRISGRKTFSTGAPVLRWGVITATADDGAAEPRLTSFLVPLAAPGVSVEASWDSLGMRATGSHTVVLDGVEVPADAEVPRSDASGGGSVPHERAWSLTVAAVYLGVAEAARDDAFAFARERRPTSLAGRSIASVPHIRQRAGRIDLQLYQARGLLVSTARAWDALQEAPPERRTALAGSLAAAKIVATNAAVAVTEDAMRLIGGSSLDRGQPLERHYRDVRAGLHHPPQEDAALELLARQALDRE
jgi:alkylation response protein AidB-like acyl-CoA dehydrogenase